MSTSKSIKQTPKLEINGGIIAPCKGCIDRYLGCHDKCDKYKEYKKAIDKYKADSKREKENSLSRYTNVRRSY